MFRGPLRVPRVLVWSLVSSATVLATACSTGTSHLLAEAGDSAALEDVAVEDVAVEDGGRDGHVPVEASADVAREAAAIDSMAVADPGSVECEGTMDASLTFFFPDGNVCPDGDLAIPLSA
jgi:hypothetical protein